LNYRHIFFINIVFYIVIYHWSVSVYYDICIEHNKEAKSGSDEIEIVEIVAQRLSYSEG
jgi:hypothetical protein